MNMVAADARAWVVWLICALATVFALDHPIVDLIVLASAGLISVAAGRWKGFRTFLVLGVMLVAVRTLLFAVTGHTGDTTLLEIPALQLPELLGGTTLGGLITAEVVASSIAEGMRIVSVMACFGAFLALTETIELIRLLPRFLFEAGLVVNIALAFVPQLARTARDVREAQRMRGERRGVVPTFVPVLINALDRSIALAETMDSRGYGRTSKDQPPARRWQLTAAAGALTLAAAGSFWALKRNSVPAGLVALAGGTALVLALVALSRSVARSRYRRGRFGRIETQVAAGAVGAVLLAIVMVQFGSGERYDPYHSLAIAPPSPVASVAAAALALPLFTFYKRSTQ